MYNLVNKRKGKPRESGGRKATGLSPKGYGRRAAVLFHQQTP